MDNEERNTILGRMNDKLEKISTQNGEMAITLAVVHERTEQIPNLGERIREVEDDVLIIQTEDTVRSQTVQRGKDNLKYALYVIGALLTIGTAYGAFFVN